MDKKQCVTAKQIAGAELSVLQFMVDGVDEQQLRELAEEIKAAKRIFVGGAGRSLLSMKGFAMRLMQTAHETYLVGEVCTPSIQPGDLLIVGSGSGKTQVTLDVVNKAKEHGARTAVLTMHADAPIARTCDCVVVIPEIPKITETDEEAAAFAKKNLAGNFGEAAITLTLDGVIGAMMKESGQDGGTIRYYHANLE